MTKTELTKIREALAEAESFIYNDLDSVCEDDYAEEAQSVIGKVREAITAIDNELQ